MRRSVVSSSRRGREERIGRSHGLCLRNRLLQPAGRSIPGRIPISQMLIYGSGRGDRARRRLPPIHLRRSLSCIHARMLLRPASVIHASLRNEKRLWGIRVCRFARGLVLIVFADSQQDSRSARTEADSCGEIRELIISSSKSASRLSFTRTSAPIFSSPQRE